MNSKDAAKKKLLESDFLAYTRWTFKQTTKQSFILGEHHKIMASALQDVLDGKIKRLKIEIPPRYSKTEFIKAFCAAGFSRNPASNFIYTSYSHKLALKCSKEIKEIITTEAFNKLWPIKIKWDTKAKELWETTADGGIYATSFGGPITGFGAGKLDGYKSATEYNFNGALIIDDPMKAQDRHSKVVREEVIDYWTGTLPSRLNSTSTPIILIMQRLHPEDLAGYIDEEDKEVQRWTTIRLPAIKEDGTPLWPAKHSIEDLELLAKNNEMFSAQYMQAPITLGGNIIKPVMFRSYREIPAMKKRYITVDTAQKDKEQNDYSVFQCWGVGQDNYLYLLDQVRGKFLYNELKIRFVAFWAKHLYLLNEQLYGYLTCAYVEDKSSATSLIQEAKAEGKIPIVAIQRNRSKLERVLDILMPKLESGFIVLPEDAPWLSDFFVECEEFNASMSHKHDDQIDAMVDGVEIGSMDIKSTHSDVFNDNLNRHILKNKNIKRKRR